MLNGVLLIDKPQQFTSFDVIAKLRGILHQKKIGHAGTLDPMATGVLPCLLGGATKLCGRFPCEEKRYTATVQFGVVTDTQDLTGRTLETYADPLSESALCAALEAFRGDIFQIPPMYSAVSIGGKRLYDLARQGKEVERAARAVTIRSLTLLSCDESSRTAVLDVVCTQGTYIRTLAHDLGQSLGLGAALSGLRRTRSNGFSLDRCVTLDSVRTLIERDALESVLLPISSVFDALPRLNTGEWQAKMLFNGVPLHLDKLGSPAPGQYSVWCNEEFLGLGLVEDAEGMRLRRF